MRNKRTTIIRLEGGNRWRSGLRGGGLFGQNLVSRSLDQGTMYANMADNSDRLTRNVRGRRLQRELTETIGKKDSQHKSLIFSLVGMYS